MMTTRTMTSNALRWSTTSEPSNALNATSATLRSWYVAVMVAITLVPVISVLAEDTKVYALQGRDVILPCRTAAKTIVDWFDYVNNELDAPINVSSRINAYKETYANRHQIDADNTLTIKEAESKDAGQYICRQRTTQTNVISYYVIVYTVPACSDSKLLQPGDSIRFGCHSFVYGGVSCENLQWFRRDSTSASDADNDVITGVASVDACEVTLAARNLTVEKVTYQNDGDVYICRLTVGDSHEQCQVVLGVEHPVREVQFHPVKPVYNVGEEIHCTAGGNPSPSIILQSSPLVDGKTIVKSSFKVPGSTSSSSIKVQKSWVGLKSPVQLNCTASNTVLDEESSQTSTITFTVTEKAVPEKEQNPKTSSSSVSGISLPVTIGIVIGIVILAVIIAIVVCMRLRKDRKEEKESKTPPVGSTQKQDQMKNDRDGKGSKTG